MKKNNRVVVTGISMITPIGNGVENYWNSVMHSKSGINYVTRFDTTDYRCKVGGEVLNFDIKDFIDFSLNGGSFDRSTGFALGAVRQTIIDSGLDMNTVQKAGCYIGIAIGGAEYGEKAYMKYHKLGDQYYDPDLYHGNIPNGCMYNLTKHFKFRGPAHTLSTGCTSSTDSVGFAFNAIRDGKAEIMLAGGTDAPITPLTYAAFGNIKALTPNIENPEKSSRPFDNKRNGFVPSEGSCFLMLEDFEHAIKRKAKIYAELLGFSSSSNAYHMVQPDPTGNQNKIAITLALKDAGVEPEMIDYFNAHGSSTKLNDSTETRIIKDIFKDHAKKIKISSTKSMTGHMLGATGATEIATTCLGIYNSVVSPTINLDDPDPECDLDYTPNFPVNQHINYAISNAVGFGGLNSVLVLKKIY